MFLLASVLDFEIKINFRGCWCEFQIVLALTIANSENANDTPHSMSPDLLR